MLTYGAQVVSSRVGRVRSFSQTIASSSAGRQEPNTISGKTSRSATRD